MDSDLQQDLNICKDDCDRGRDDRDRQDSSRIRYIRGHSEAVEGDASGAKRAKRVKGQHTDVRYTQIHLSESSIRVRRKPRGRNAWTQTLPSWTSDFPTQAQDSDSE
jgi:hypothetical protein